MAIACVGAPLKMGFFGGVCQIFTFSAKKVDNSLFFSDMVREYSRNQRRKSNMKNATVIAESATDIPEGDLKLKMPWPHTQDWHLAPNGNPHLHGNFPRFKNGPARCRLRRPFNKYPTG
jgi:hypothetical protein